MSNGTGNLVTRVYSNFRGVDFRGDEINLVRSPDSLNMWKDYKETESIRTRPGMQRFLPGKVNSLTLYKGNVIMHQGTTLYQLKGEAKVKILATNLNDAPSNIFFYGGKGYIMDGTSYKCFDGTSLAKEVEGYVPTTTISRAPAGGGERHEDVNLLQPKRKNSFLADGTSTSYYLDVEEADSIVRVLVNGEEVTNYSYFVETFKDNQTGVERKGCGVKFDKAPPAPLTDGQDTVVIEFSKVVEGYRETILNCTMVTVFDSRVFVSGNSNYPNRVWHSSLHDPTYYSDQDIYMEGMDDAAVKGMVAGNNALWVFREPSAENTSIFYHTPTIDDQYGKIYPSYHSSIAAGCVGKAINFNDDIVFFSSRGMEGISGDVTSEQVVAHRSSLVDRKLLAEPDYANMVLAEWAGYLIVFIGNKAYLADSRSVVTVDNHTEYEWFYWELEKPVTNAITLNDVLYVGTDDGVYAFTDYTGSVESYWTTPKDKFNYPHMQKTTNKRGCVAESTGDMTVYAKVEDTDFQLIGEYPSVKDYFVTRIKCKKFKDIQLKFHSKTRFSLETVTLEAWVGGYIKR